MVSYAPFEYNQPILQPVYRPNVVKVPTVSDDTECNFVVMAFVGGIIFMGIMDSLRR